MDQQDNQDPRAGQPDRPDERAQARPGAKPRTDRLTAAKVEKGLFVQRTASTREAAQYMASNGVPLHVAVRVLTTPHKRDMRDLLRAPPSWHDIIRSSGTAFGVPLEMRP